MFSSLDESAVPVLLKRVDTVNGKIKNSCTITYDVVELLKEGQSAE